MMTLAISDGWHIGMWAINLLFTAALGIGLLWVKGKAQKIDTLEHRVRVDAERLVDEKLTGLANRLEGCLDVLNERVGAVRERLAAGDSDFRDLNKRDHELELKFNARSEQLKDYIQHHFATKDELAGVAGRVQRLEQGGSA